MKKNILLFLALFFFHFIHGQVVERAVWASAGGSIQSGSFYVSGTAGEAVVSTLYGNDLILTQGFQQPLIGKESGVNEVFNNDVFEVFPIPANQYFQIISKTNMVTGDKVLLTDVLGKAVKSIPMSQNSIQIDVTDMKNGVYYLSILREDREIIYSSLIAVIND